MKAVSTGMAAGARDKRYASQALLVDLRDAECDAESWSASSFTVSKAPKGALASLVDETLATGVFAVDGETSHGLFEAAIEELDAERGHLHARFVWISEDGRKLLAGAVDPTRTMKLAFGHATLNWSFSGLQLSSYRGDAKPGQRLRGMIWTDSPGDPGLFVATVVRPDSAHHTLSLKFADLPDATFGLLERAMTKRDGGFRKGHLG
jgi:hypothetical protein